MNEQPSISEEGPAPPRERAGLGAKLASLAAILAAATALISLIPEFREKAEDAYCSIFRCERAFVTPDMTKLGHMRAVKVFLIRQSGSGQVNFVIQWNWTGSHGGFQNGSQSVKFDFKDSAGVTHDTIILPVDRSHCYQEPGHPETKKGGLGAGVKLRDVNSVEATLLEATGGVDPC